MKTGRHQKILEIISEHPVETQDEIIALLKEAGYKATQATISRDIKDLRLVKTLGSDGKYRYISDTGRDPDLRGGFNRLFAGSVRSVEQAQNLVVIKTLSGTANAVCAARHIAATAIAFQPVNILHIAIVCSICPFCCVYYTCTLRRRQL